MYPYIYWLACVQFIACVVYIYICLCFRHDVHKCAYSEKHQEPDDVLVADGFLLRLSIGRSIIYGGYENRSAMRAFINCENIFQGDRSLLIAVGKLRARGVFRFIFIFILRVCRRFGTMYNR